MWLMLPFLLNSLLNFAVNLLVAKFLGPAEYGRLGLAISLAIVLQTLLFDWLRLAATRFYSERDRLTRPQIRATLDAAFAGLASLALIAAVALWRLQPDLAISADLAALAVCVSITNGLFDFASALARARFQDRLYGALVIAKNLLAFALTVGGAFLFHSAAVALLGMATSVVGSLLFAGKALLDPHTGLRVARRELAFRFLAYGFPIVFASSLYQATPLLNRTIAAQAYGFAEVGQLSLAFEIGVRIVGAIGSAIDVLLFQLAVHREKTEGPDAARAQITRNLGVVFAIVAPAVAGCWLVLPSFEALFTPERFRGPFAQYFALMTPALFAFAMINYGINTAFQLSHRLSPLVIAALVALIANLLAVAFLPSTADASRFAVAQSISSCGGLLALGSMLLLLEPMLPRARDIAGALAATLAMLALGTPLRALPPGAATFALQIGWGVLVYGALAYGFDVAGLKRDIGARIMARRSPEARGGR
jgi:O-antigen/teichoic acid export membrane protein